MRKTLKIIGIISSGLVVLAVVLTLVVSFLIPWDKVKEKIAEKASLELKREVKIEKISFGLFKGVELRNFYIGNSEGFTKGAFVSAGSVLAKYDLWALFRKQVILTKIELVEPYILVEKDKKGKYNFSDIVDALNAAGKSPAAKVKAESPAAVELPVELSISKFTLTSGTVKYTDISSVPGVFLEIKNIDVSVLGLSLESVKPVILKGSATIDYNKMPVDFSFQGSLGIALKEQSFKLDNFSARLAGVELFVSGEVTKCFTLPLFKLETRAEIDCEKALKLAGGLLPEKMRVYIEDTRMGGDVSFDLKAEGSLEKTQKSYTVNAGGSGSLDLSKMAVSYSTYFAKPKNHKVSLDYNFKLAGEELNADAGLKLEESSFKLKMNSKGFEAPRIKAGFEAEAGIKEVFSLLPLMAGVSAAGKAKLTGNITLPLKKDFSVDYRGLALEAGGKLLDFSAKSKQFNYAVSKMNADLKFSEKTLELQNLAFLTGSSPFSGYLSAGGFNLETMTEWKTKFTGDVKFNLKCQKFLIDELMEALPEKKTAVPASAKVPGPEANPGFTNEELNGYLMYLNPGLKVDGRVEIKELAYKKVKFSELRSSVKLANRTADLTTALNAYSGTIANTLQIDMNVPGLGYALTAELKGVQAGELLNDFIDSFVKPDFAGSLKDKISGAAAGGLDLKGAGANLKDVKKNLRGALEYKLVNGKLRNWKFLGDALAALKVNRTDEINFREFTGRHKVTDQKVTFEEFKIVCDDARYGVASTGYVNFDKNLASRIFLPVRNDLSPAISGGLGDVGKFGSDDKGWFPADVDIGGVLESPAFAPNLERAQNNLKNKAQEELKKKEGELKNKATDLLKGLFGR